MGTGTIECGLFSLAILASMAILFFKRWMLDALIEALHNFRGGPPTPMHPSPVNDSAFLRKRK